MGASGLARLPVLVRGRALYEPTEPSDDSPCVSDGLNRLINGDVSKGAVRSAWPLEQRTQQAA